MWIGNNLNYPYYGVDYKGCFDNWSFEQMTRQKMNVIELPSGLPKRGDKVLVWDYDEEKASERIFLAYLDGTDNPVITVCSCDEDAYLNNKPVSISVWKNYKLIEIILELTLDEVAQKFNVSTVKIIKSK